MHFLHCLPIMFLAVLLMMTSCGPEDVPDPDNNRRRKSPIAIAKLKHEDTYVKIVYGQPYKNGREIFGGLVPFNEVWRTGANEATELTTTGELMIGGQKLSPGTYSLFTIPGRESWTIIINKELGLWGAFDYNAEMDVFREVVPASKEDQVSEVFTIMFEEVENDSTSVILRWDKTKVQIPLSFPSTDSST